MIFELLIPLEPQEGTPRSGGSIESLTLYSEGNEPSLLIDFLNIIYKFKNDDDGNSISRRFIDITFKVSIEYN